VTHDDDVEAGMVVEIEEVVGGLAIPEPRRRGVVEDVGRTKKGYVHAIVVRDESNGESLRAVRDSLRDEPLRFAVAAGPRRMRSRDVYAFVTPL
jgi:hypothetical protein